VEEDVATAVSTDMKSSGQPTTRCSSVAAWHPERSAVRQEVLP
jgi:hypothetical protein